MKYADERPEDLDGAAAEFAASTAPDLRVPLTLLLGPLQDLLDGPAAELAPGTRRVLERARQNAVRLLSVLDATPVPEAPADLASFTAALVDRFQAYCDERGVRLVADCLPATEDADVERAAWKKIVVNLVANALSSVEEGTVAVRLRIEDGHARLMVSDTGDGIATGELPYVFDRIGAPSHAGLAVARDLVRACGGSIDLQSTPGRGTVVRVSVPVSPGTTTAARGITGAQPLPRSHLPAPTIDTVSGRRGHVVVAEDHAETREYLAAVLETAGFTVIAAADGDRALAECTSRAPDVLVSDVLMPGLGGYDLIAQLRADERTAIIPVLLLSARSGEDARIEGIAAGADDYLIKPLSGRELVARVDGAVRLGRLRRDIARREQADLEALFSLAPDGVVVAGRNGGILAANEQAAALFGYSRAELLTMTVEALMPPRLARAHAGHREGYARGPVVRQMNPHHGLPCLRRDGGEFIAEIALGPLQFRNQACTMAIIRDVTERKRLETERAEQERRFRDLSARVVAVQEAERRQLSTELHDRTSPHLAAIQINLKMLGHLLRDRETEDVSALLDDTVHLIADTTSGIREISSDLRPAVLDDGGLLPALTAYARQFTQRTGIQVCFRADDTVSGLSAAVQSSLFRIVQEALTNCVKHANAGLVTIHLGADAAGRMQLTIADDGVGFDAGAQDTTGLGLLTMRERAEFVGGQFVLEARPGRGTRIQVVV